MVLIKYSGKYVKIYFNMKITFLFFSCYKMYWNHSVPFFKSFYFLYKNYI